MFEDELNDRLKELKLTLNDACGLIHIKTNVVIDPRHVRNGLDRGALSKPMSACFALLFSQLEVAQHGSV
tara:strand:+ start:6745 stop:6954 length:210 start_codon:yes stop_codon:yes gene_type:complete